MKTVECKIDNRWDWSLKRACIGVTSPSGNTAWIRKLDADLPTDADWTVMKEKILDARDGSVVELTLEEMQRVARIAKLSGKVVSAKPVAEKRMDTKAKPHKSYAARQFERAQQVHTNNQSILGGCCPSCGSRSLKVKDHGSWVGYFCKPCGAGGSITRNKK